MLAEVCDTRVLKMTLGNLPPNSLKESIYFSHNCGIHFAQTVESHFWKELIKTKRKWMCFCH